MPWIEDCHVWVGATNCYLKCVGELWKWVCGSCGTTLAACLEALAHHQNVACIIVSGNDLNESCSSDLIELAPLPYFCG